MSQLIDGAIAGILGGLIVLLIALVQKKKESKLTGEIPVGREWNRLSMISMFVLTGFLPLAGFILSIVGMFFRSKRKQSIFLLFFTIGVTAMYLLEKSEWGLIFGILIAICCSVYFGKYTTRSIAIAILLFVVVAISYDVLIHTDYFWNTFTSSLGWEHPH